MEKRKNVRIKICGDVKCKMILATAIDIIDLSLDGVRFISSRRVNTNSICTIKISRDDYFLNLKGQVVRSMLKKTTEEEGNVIPLYEVAMNFIKLDAQIMKRLEDLIKIINNEPADSNSAR
jgi:hypothetical protein